MKGPVRWNLRLGIIRATFASFVIFDVACSMLKSLFDYLRVVTKFPDEIVGKKFISISILDDFTDEEV